ncbi:MAG TPA: hypothetical protein PLC58_13430 [Denitromonas sp.]|nr:hypothetical protein [Denitromonas sp.]
MTHPTWVDMAFAANAPLTKRGQPKGSASPNARMTEADVIAARKAHKRAMALVKRIHASYSVEALAARNGVSLRAMQMALSGETWGHV